MSTVTVRMNSEEEKLFKEYSEFKNLPVSTLMKMALEEKIEDEIDIKSILEYEERLVNNEAEYVSLEQIKEELGLKDEV